MMMMMMIVLIIDYFLKVSDEEVAQMRKMFPYAPSRPLRFLGQPSPSRRRSSSPTHSKIVRNRSQENRRLLSAIHSGEYLCLYFKLSGRKPNLSGFNTSVTTSSVQKGLNTMAENKLGPCMQCVRFILFAFNALFWVSFH